MEVDEPGGDDGAVGVEDGGAGGGVDVVGHGADEPVLHEDVGPARPTGVDDRPALDDDDGAHAALPSPEPSNM